MWQQLAGPGAVPPSEKATRRRRRFSFFLSTPSTSAGPRSLCRITVPSAWETEQVGKLLAYGGVQRECAKGCARRLLHRAVRALTEASEQHGDCACAGHGTAVRLGRANRSDGRCSRRSDLGDARS